MRGARLILLLLFLFPTVSVAAPCCDEAPATECCGPAAECPSSPSGECLLMADAPPRASAVSMALDVPASTRVATAEPPTLPGSRGPALVASGRGHSPPLYLALTKLRN